MAPYQAKVYLELGNASGWLEHAHVHAAQLAWLAGQQALTHEVGLLHECSLAHLRKGCVCAHVRVPSLHSCGPVSLSPPQPGHQATMVGATVLQYVFFLILSNILIILAYLI